MSTSLAEDDERVLRKWTRSYAQRLYQYAAFSIVGAASGLGGLWNLAETVLDGGRLGLSAWQTLTGQPLVQPLDTYRLLATASGSYIMFSTTLICVLAIVFIRRDARRYELFQKLQHTDVARA